MSKKNINLKGVEVKRGYIYLCDLGEGLDSEQGGVRPALVIKNQKGCDNGTVITIVPITSKINKGRNLPTHISIGQECGLKMDSELQLEQMRAVSKSRFLFEDNQLRRLGKATSIVMEKVESAMLKDTGFIDINFNENHAFHLLSLISEIKNNPTLKLTKQYLVGEFKKYCGDYNKDYMVIMKSYNTKVIALRRKPELPSAI